MKEVETAKASQKIQSPTDWLCEHSKHIEQPRFALKKRDFRDSKQNGVTDHDDKLKHKERKYCDDHPFVVGSQHITLKFGLLLHKKLEGKKEPYHHVDICEELQKASKDQRDVKELHRLINKEVDLHYTCSDHEAHVHNTHSAHRLRSPLAILLVSFAFYMVLESPHLEDEEDLGDKDQSDC